jgi:hypothetical protein
MRATDSNHTKVCTYTTRRTAPLAAAQTKSSATYLLHRCHELRCAGDRQVRCACNSHDAAAVTFDLQPWRLRRREWCSAARPALLLRQQQICQGVL